MSTTTQTFAVSVLLHRDEDAWVAQCLEYDVAAQADDLETVKKRFLSTLACQILTDMSEGREPLAELGPAPQHCHDMLTKSLVGGPELPVYMPVIKGKPRVNARARFLQESQQPQAT